MRYFVQLSIYHKEINVHPAVHAYKSPVSYNVSFLSKEWADWRKWQWSREKVSSTYFGICACFYILFYHHNHGCILQSNACGSEEEKRDLNYCHLLFCLLSFFLSFFFLNNLFIFRWWMVILLIFMSRNSGTI